MTRIVMQSANRREIKDFQGAREGRLFYERLVLTKGGITYAKLITNGKLTASKILV